jgi:GntR family transcriptional regulator
VSPKVNRPVAPYMQVTDHFRRQIQDGSLCEGDRLPAVAAIARDWGVAHATAAKAVQQLQVEGLISTSPRGSFVAAKAARASSQYDRIMRARRTGSISSTDEHHTVAAAEVIDPPAYVADLLDLEPNEQVVRREWVSIENTALRALTVTWYPASLVDQVPELLTKTNSSVDQLLHRLEQTLGPVAKGRDFYHARGADRREASALGLPVGSAILAGTWILWSAAGHLSEYGETCLPPRSTVSYPYEITDENDGNVTDD